MPAKTTKTKKASTTKGRAAKASATKGRAAKASATKPPARVKVESVTPFLWFDDDAEEAARFYVSLFAGSRILRSDPMSVEFNLAGQDVYALNGGDVYQHTPAFSMFVSVETQEDVDRLWDALIAGGGRPDRCGWLVDRFGLSWQIIPRRLVQLLRHKDPKVARRATDAMLKMEKIDVAALNAAAKGG